MENDGVRRISPMERVAQVEAAGRSGEKRKRRKGKEKQAEATRRAEEESQSPGADGEEPPTKGGKLDLRA